MSKAIKPKKPLPRKSVGMKSPKAAKKTAARKSVSKTERKAKVKPAKAKPMARRKPKAKLDVKAKVSKRVQTRVTSRKNDLHEEINAAFRLCMASIEQASNLMESRLASVLGEISNLVSGAKPTFAAGKLKSVVSPDGVEKTDYSYAKNGTVTSRTYRNGKLKFEIIHNKFGVPLSGKMLDESGNCIREFQYGPDGQVK